MESIQPYLADLFSVYIAITIAFTSPGPNFLGIVSSAVQNRMNGVFVGLGISAGTAIWALFAATGITAILAKYPNAAFVLGLLGGLYLCWLGIKSLRSVRTTVELKVEDGDQLAPSEPLSNLKKGLLIQLTNPKTALFWLAITSLVVSPESPAIVIFLLVTGCFFIAVIWHILLALVFSSGPARKSYLRFKPIISTIFGLLFVAFGLRLVFSNFAWFLNSITDKVV